MGARDQGYAENGQELCAMPGGGAVLYDGGGSDMTITSEIIWIWVLSLAAVALAGFLCGRVWEGWRHDR